MPRTAALPAAGFGGATSRLSHRPRAYTAARSAVKTSGRTKAAPLSSWEGTRCGLLRWVVIMGRLLSLAGLAHTFRGSLRPERQRLRQPWERRPKVRRGRDTGPRVSAVMALCASRGAENEDRPLGLIGGLRRPVAPRFGLVHDGPVLPRPVIVDALAEQGASCCGLSPPAIINRSRRPRVLRRAPLVPPEGPSSHLARWRSLTSVRYRSGWVGRPGALPIGRAR